MKLRKFLSLLLVATLFVGLSSCSDDDDNDSPDAILGTWKYMRTELDFKTSNAQVKNALNELAEDGEFDENPHTITFTEDGEYTWKEGGSVEYGDYRYSNGKLELDDDSMLYKVSISGSTAKLSFSILEYFLDMLEEEGISAAESGLTKLDLVMIYQKQ